MIAPKMEELLNDQINREFYSAYLYLAMSAHLQNQELPGHAHWMYLQYLEELGHGLKFYNFVHERDGKVSLGAVAAPPKRWNSVLELFEETLRHELLITDSINHLVHASLEHKDFATHNFLQWFVSEQVEEESNVRQTLQKVKMVQDSSHGLYLLDKELASRQLSLPIPELNPSLRAN